MVKYTHAPMFECRDTTTTNNIDRMLASRETEDDSTARCDTGNNVLLMTNNIARDKPCEICACNVRHNSVLNLYESLYWAQNSPNYPEKIVHADRVCGVRQV